ncbi:MAG: hypothetical protein MK138_04100, partial [Planctomycetes bacterium]|nr:hypothetical protein [Planctomycetota bacterium]
MTDRAGEPAGKFTSRRQSMRARRAKAALLQPVPSLIHCPASMINKGTISNLVSGTLLLTGLL